MQHGIFKAFIALLILSSTSVSLAQTQQSTEKAAVNTSTQVKFITNQGEFVVQLYPEQAPITVANFLHYVDTGFYNGTIFHRVIKGFMIQGGGFNTEFAKKATGKPIKNESDNRLKNTRGTLSMARTSNIHSATAQFFINTNNNASLNYRGARHGYAVFGKVMKGYEVVSNIENQATGVYRQYRDVPKNTVVIKQVIRLKKPYKN